MNEKPNFYNLYQKVGSIEGRLDTIEKSVNKVAENHELRLNCLERTTDQMVGKASVFGFLGGIIVSIIGWFIKK